MKTVLIIAILAVAGYFGYTHFFAESNSASGAYSLADIESRPIPKKEFFSLWTDSAHKQCANAKEAHNLTPDECKEKVTQRTTSCESSTGGTAPAIIGDLALGKKLGTDYLECVTPHYYCKGIEVKSEAEIRQHCSDVRLQYRAHEPRQAVV